MHIKAIYALLGVMVTMAGTSHAAELTAQDLVDYKAAYKKVVDEGYRIFHTPQGANGVACDMCHPNAADTHPETYPKFQIQLGKVAALRDMINWCIINPAKGTAFDANDPRMLALEAYITSERNGLSLAPGKH
ncbi:MAG: cytochrome C [Nitrospinae bacterium]|nr:cytochrome C [Nitrospinota bacterium]